MRKFLNEFREFAMRGSVMDLAIGVIIGGAFGKIISSLVNDIVMPPLSALTGGINFADLKYTIGRATLNYGSFIQNVVDFLIVALAVFLMVKAMNRMHQKKQAPAEESREVQLLSEIRDELRRF